MPARGLMSKATGPVARTDCPRPPSCPLIEAPADAASGTGSCGSLQSTGVLTTDGADKTYCFTHVNVRGS